jgi:hypothetical protein
MAGLTNVSYIGDLDAMGRFPARKRDTPTNSRSVEHNVAFIQLDGGLVVYKYDEAKTPNQRQRVNVISKEQNIVHDKLGYKVHCMHQDAVFGHRSICSKQLTGLQRLGPDGPLLREVFHHKYKNWGGAFTGPKGIPV